MLTNIGNLHNLEELLIIQSEIEEQQKTMGKFVESLRAIGLLISLKKLVLDMEGPMVLPIGFGNLNKLKTMELIPKDPFTHLGACIS